MTPNGEQKRYQYGLGSRAALLAMIRCIWTVLRFVYQLSCVHLLMYVWHMCPCECFTRVYLYKSEITVKRRKKNNSKPNRDTKCDMQIWFCFSHWVFNVYCISNAFCYSLLWNAIYFVLFSRSCSCSPASLLSNTNDDDDYNKIGTSACVWCSSDFSLVSSALASHSQLLLQLQIYSEFWIRNSHLSVHLHTLLKLFIFTTVPNAGFKQFHIWFRPVFIYNYFRCNLWSE